MTPAPGARISDVDVVLLDTASLYYRSFYALPSTMTAPDGFPHNAVRGLLQTIERLRDRLAPRTVVAAWDYDWRPQWRVDLLPTYKTHRLADEGSETEDEPDELSPQIDAIHRILDSWGVPVVGAPGFEADDVLGTLTGHVSSMGSSAVVVTGDRDLVQLIDEGVRVLLTVKGGMDAWPLLDVAGTIERFGVAPHQYVDVAVLRGDPSDGLPGVPGIGAKTAVSLIAHYGSLAELRAACAQATLARPLTPRIAEAVNEHADYLQNASVVSTVRRDVPVEDPRRVLCLPVPSHPVQPAAWEACVEEWGVRRFAEAAMRQPGHSRTGE